MSPPLRSHLVDFNHGYDAGYKQAIEDLRAALLPLSEHFIDVHPRRADELRELLYPFEEYLEGRIERMTPNGEFEGGLGI